MSWKAKRRDAFLTVYTNNKTVVWVNFEFACEVRNKGFCFHLFWLWNFWERVNECWFWKSRLLKIEFRNFMKFIFWMLVFTLWLTKAVIELHNFIKYIFWMLVFTLWLIKAVKISKNFNKDRMFLKHNNYAFILKLCSIML